MNTQQQQTAQWLDMDDLIRLARRSSHANASQFQWEQTFAEVQRRAEVVYNPQEKAAYQELSLHMGYLETNYSPALRHYYMLQHCDVEYRRRRSPRARAAYAWCEAVLGYISVPTNVKLCPKCQHDRVWYGGYCTNCLWNDEQQCYPPVEFRFCENELEQTKHYLASYQYAAQWRCQTCNHATTEGE